MTKITADQARLLQTVASTDNGQIEAPTQAKLKRIAAALLKRGFILSLPRADGPSWLMITEAGRKAVGEPAPRSAPSKSAVSSAPQSSQRGAKSAGGKLGRILDLLRQPEGATLPVMMEATGWQAHSVRGAIAGAVKKKLGLTVASEKVGQERVYRIVEGAGA